MQSVADRLTDVFSSRSGGDAESPTPGHHGHQSPGTGGRLKRLHRQNLRQGGRDGEVIRRDWAGTAEPSRRERRPDSDTERQGRDGRHAALQVSRESAQEGRDGQTLIQRDWAGTQACGAAGEPRICAGRERRPSSDTERQGRDGRRAALQATRDRGRSQDVSRSVQV